MFSRSNNDQDRESSVDGYVACIVHFCHDEDIQSLKFFLRSNNQTGELLKDLKEQAEAAQLRAIEERRNRDREALGKKSPETAPSASPSPLFKRADALSLDVNAERQSLSHRTLSDLALDELTHVPVYDWDEPLKLIEGKFATPDSEAHKRSIEVFKKLKARGAFAQDCRTS